MTNAELFKNIFGIYSEEFWSYTEKQMLDWINADVPDTNVGDMISRQAAIESAEKESQVDGAYGYMDIKSIVDMLNDLPSAQRWIPVTERLPDPYTQDILVTVNDGGIYIDVLNYDTPGDGTYEVKWYKTDYDGYPIIYNDVVAWMDMKPWKGGE